jgi:hypothetical protein
VLSTGFSVKGKKTTRGTGEDNDCMRRIRGLSSWVGILHVLQLRRIFADHSAEQQRLSVYAAHAKLRQSGWPSLEHGNKVAAAPRVSWQRLHGAVDDKRERVACCAESTRCTLLGQGHVEPTREV